MATTFLLLLGLGLVLVVPSESTMKTIREKCSQKEMQSEVSMTSTLSDKNISLNGSRNVMSASPISRRLYFIIPKGNTLSNEQNYPDSPRVWRKALDKNESCQLGNSFAHGSSDVIAGVPKAISWKCGQAPSLGYCESLGLEHTMCKITAGQQCPRCQEPSITSLKRILMVLTSHSLMSWLVSGSKL